MAIKIYSGRPGTGKSYNAVANVIIPAIKQARTVVTNVVLNKSEIYDDYPDANILTIPFALTHSDIANYLDLSLWPRGSVFVIDEGAKLFPTGQKVTNVPPSLITFFTEHRHSVGSDGYSSEIFVLAQDSSQLAKFLRDLVDTTYHHVKLDKHGMSKTFRVDIYDGCVSGANPRGDFVESKLGKYKDNVTKYYKSHTQKAAGTDTALEASPDQRGSNIKVYVYAVLAVPAFLVLGYFALSSFDSLFSSGAEVPPDVVPVQSEDVSSASFHTEPVPVSRSRNDAPSLSDDWRLSGVISGANGLVAIIESTDRSRFLNALTSCEYDRDISEWYCVLNGQVVASYTGPVWSPDEDSGLDLPFSE